MNNPKLCPRNRLTIATERRKQQQYMWPTKKKTKKKSVIELKAIWLTAWFVNKWSVLIVKKAIFMSYTRLIWFMCMLLFGAWLLYACALSYSLFIVHFNCLFLFSKFSWYGVQHVVLLIIITCVDLFFVFLVVHLFNVLNQFSLFWYLDIFIYRIICSV